MFLRCMPGMRRLQVMDRAAPNFYVRGSISQDLLDAPYRVALYS